MKALAEHIFQLKNDAEQGRASSARLAKLQEFIRHKGVITLKNWQSTRS